MVSIYFTLLPLTDVSKLTLGLYKLLVLPVVLQLLPSFNQICVFIIYTNLDTSVYEYECTHI